MRVKYLNLSLKKKFKLRDGEVLFLL